MTPETVGLFAAILFLLIAVVGGGFTLKEVSIPIVPMWARVTAGVLGVLFAVPFALSLARPDLGGGQDGEESFADAPADAPVEEPADAPDEGPAVLYHDEPADESPEQIRLIEVTATSDRQDVRVNDPVAVTFTIENAGAEPFQLSYTFVGSRTPDDEYGGSFGEGNHDDVLQPGEELTVTASKHVTEPGIWVFFPCYEFEENGEPAYCPPRWEGFEVLVGQ